MPGTPKTSIGLAVAGVGLLISGIIFANAFGGYVVLAYGAIAAGSTLLIVGSVQFVRYRAKASRGAPKIPADASTRAILQAMMATSFADGKIQDEEILRIADVYGQIFGSDLDETWIKETANSMLKKDFDIAVALGQKHKLIDSSLKPLILEAAYHVAAADGFLAEKERAVLFSMAGALRMTENQIAAVSRKLAGPDGNA